jgi:D-arabinose 1-dehydrogenase-like Zn-dependent alcohol dehydrogenase
MKAAIFEVQGKPLRIMDVKEPIRTNNSIILKVLATGLCHGDIHIIMGDWQGDLDIRTPIILGHEIIGEVVNNGKKVKKGDMVLVYNAFGCNSCKYCKLGYYQYCEKVKVLGVHENGGFAEYVKIPDENNLIKVEGNPFSLVPLADAGITAYNASEGIGRGDKVAVLGTGAVSIIAIQILKALGAEVTVVGRNSVKLSKIQELGVDEIIFSRGEYARDLSEKSTTRKFDFILDFIGSELTLDDISWMLSRMGELRIIGEFGGTLKIPEQLIVLRGLKIKGILYGKKEHLIAVLKLFQEGKIKTFPVLYRLDEINSAINDLIAGRVIGRAVIVP